MLAGIKGLRDFSLSLWIQRKWKSDKKISYLCNVSEYWKCTLREIHSNEIYIPIEFSLKKYRKVFGCLCKHCYLFRPSRWSPSQWMMHNSKCDWVSLYIYLLVGSRVKFGIRKLPKIDRHNNLTLFFIIALGGLSVKLLHFSIYFGSVMWYVPCMNQSHYRLTFSNTQYIYMSIYFRSTVYLLVQKSGWKVLWKYNLCLVTHKFWTHIIIIIECEHSQ